MVPFVSAQGKLKLTMSEIPLQSPNYETASSLVVSLILILYQS